MRADAGTASLLAAAALLLAACAGGDAPPPDAIRAGDLELTTAVAPEPVTGDRTALYLRIRSTGEADTLAGVDVGDLGRASLHRSRRTDRGMAMMPVDGVAVPAGGRVELRPGGYHAMVEELRRAPVAGDTVRATLRFRRAGQVEVPFRVVAYAALDSIFGPGDREAR